MKNNNTPETGAPSGPDTLMSFDDFVRVNWPRGVSTDCTRLRGDVDCIERNLPRSAQCFSCRTFVNLARDFEKENNRAAAQRT